MIERELQQVVTELATLTGWRFYHTYDSRRSNPGFPDLVLVRGDTLLFVELKSKRGRLTPEQSDWLDALKAAGQSVKVWRPDDWTSGEIAEVLR